MPEYSISQIEKFEECPRQDKFTYVDRIPRYEESVEAFLGQRFHDATIPSRRAGSWASSGSSGSRSTTKGSAGAMPSSTG